MTTSLRTPRKAAAGLGAAKTGTGHFIQQRVTAIALAVLGPWFAFAVATSLDGGHSGAREFIAQPVTTVLLLLFITAAFHHMRIGMQVVIEDYVAGHGARIALLVLNTFAVAALWVTAVVSILMIAL